MKKIITAAVLGAALLLTGCAAADTGSTTSTPGQVVTDAATPDASTPEASTPAAPAYTASQEQAIQAAQGYLEMGGFSEKSLVAQLTSDYGNGFSKADAVFAVKHVKADWNEQAVIAAKGYMEMGGFSHKSLVSQLTSKYGNQFTKAQAEYAAKAVGL